MLVGEQPGDAEDLPDAPSSTGGSCSTCLAEAGTSSEDLLTKMLSNTSTGYRVGHVVSHINRVPVEIEPVFPARGRDRWWRRASFVRAGGDRGPSLFGKTRVARTAAALWHSHWRPMRSPPCILVAAAELRTEETRQREIPRFIEDLRQFAAISSDGAPHLQENGDEIDR